MAAPLRYVAAFNRHVLNRNAAAFIRFLAIDEVRTSLRQAGLEIDT
ncbi:hypothetical protein [Lichenicoccus sp.]